MFSFPDSKRHGANMGGKHGTYRPLMGPMFAPWSLLSGLLCSWTSGWANNRDTGDLRRHRAHYGATVMYFTTAHHQPDMYGTITSYPKMRIWHEKVIWNNWSSVNYFGRFFISEKKNIYGFWEQGSENSPCPAGRFETSSKFHSLCFIDIIWRPLVKACSLATPSHYLDQWWLVTKRFLWYSAESSLTINMYHVFGVCTDMIINTSS